MEENLSNLVSEDAFWDWLKSRVTPRQLSEMFRYALLLKDYYVPKYHFSSSILEEMARTSSDAVRKIITQDKHYQKKYGGYDRQFISSLLDYMDYYLKENKPKITPVSIIQSSEERITVNKTPETKESSDKSETIVAITSDIVRNTFILYMKQRVPWQIDDLMHSLENLEKDVKQDRLFAADMDDNLRTVSLLRYRNKYKESSRTDTKVLDLLEKFFNRQKQKPDWSVNYPSEMTVIDTGDHSVSAPAKLETDNPSAEVSLPDSGQLQSETKPTIIADADPSNEIIDFTNIGDISFCQPVSVRYYGKRTEVNSWRSLYGMLCNFLCFEHPDVFERLREESLQGSGGLRLVDAANKNKLTVAYSLGNGYFIEVNRSAGDLIRNLKYILDRCGVDYHNVIIEYTRQKTKEEKKGNPNEDVRLALKNLSNETEKGISAGMVSKQINGRLIPFQVMQILDQAEWARKIGHNSYRYIQQGTTDTTDLEENAIFEPVVSDNSLQQGENSIVIEAQTEEMPTPLVSEQKNDGSGFQKNSAITISTVKETDNEPEIKTAYGNSADPLQQSDQQNLIESVRTALEDISRKRPYGVSVAYIASKLNEDKIKVFKILMDAEWAKETYDSLYIYSQEKSNANEKQYDSNANYDQFVAYLEAEGVDKNLISDICESIIDFGAWHKHTKKELFIQDLDQCRQIEGKMWKSLSEVPRHDFLRFRRAVEYYGDFLGHLKKQENSVTSSAPVSDNNSHYTTNDTELITDSEKNQEKNNEKTEEHSDDDFWKWLDARVTPTYITELYSISNELNSVLASIYHYRTSVFDEMLISSYEIVSKEIFSAPNFKQFFDDYQRKRISEYLIFIRDYISSSKKGDDNVLNTAEDTNSDQTVAAPTIEIDTLPQVEESNRDKGRISDDQTIQSIDEYDTQPHSGGSVRKLDIANPEDLSNTTPICIQLYKDRNSSVKTWEDVYVQFLSLLNSIKRSVLFSGMKLSKNSKNIDIGSKIHLRSFKNYRRIPGTSLYVRTEGSANDYVARIKFLLDKKNIPYDKLIITYQENASIPPTVEPDLIGANETAQFVDPSAPENNADYSETNGTNVATDQSISISDPDVPSAQPRWTLQEAAVLLDAYLKVQEHPEQRKALVQQVSDLLRQMAINQGMDISEKYRNTNGISFQMSSMETAWTGRNPVGHAHSNKAFTEIVRLYRDEKNNYNNLLQEAQTLSGLDSKKSDAPLVIKKKFQDFMNQHGVSYSNQMYYCDRLEHMASDFREILFGESVEHCLGVVKKIKEKITAYGTTSSKKEALYFFEHYLTDSSSIENDTSNEGTTNENHVSAWDDHNDENQPEESIEIDENTCNSENEEWILAQLKSKGLVYKDNRAKKGCLWIVGGRELKSFMQECKTHGYKMFFKPYGCKTYPNKACWGTTNIVYSETLSQTQNPSTVNINISDVLKRHYEYGFKYDSIRELMRFRQFSEQMGIVLPDDDEILRSSILSSGIVIDGKVYCKSDDMSQELQQIVEQAFSAGANVIYYESLYEIEQEWMESYVITSPEMLKEYLIKNITGCSFSKRFMFKGNKRPEKKVVTEEIIRVWDTHPTEKVDTLNERLPFIPLGNIWRVISGNNLFERVSDGEYLYIDRFHITDEEEEDILDFVDEMCEKNGYASLNDVPLGDIEETNFEIEGSVIYYAIYKKILFGKYQLNGKILTREKSALDAVSLLKQYIKDKDECTYDEASEKIQELTGTSNRVYAFQALYDDMVRVDRNRFVANGYVSFSVDETDAALSRFVVDHFIAIHDITTFAMFPFCGQSWNHYLLESFCYKYSRKYSLHVIHFNDKNAGIIAERNYNRKYEEMLAIAAARSDIELSPEAVGQYLFDAGYMAKSKYAKLDEITQLALELRKKR